MKKTLLSVSGFLLVLATLSSCRRGPVTAVQPAEPIRQDFEVVYDNASMTTAASAVFRSKDITGARIQLTNGTAFSINSQSPNYEPLSYTYSWSDNGYQNVIFTLHKNSGETFTNTVNIGDTLGSYFPAGMSQTIYKSIGLNFNALGIPFADNENLVVTLVGNDQFGHYATETHNFANSAISFTHNDLASFQNGPITIQIKRQRTMGVQQPDGTAGGSRIISLQVQQSFTLTN